jgi:hypothetical protein
MQAYKAMKLVTDICCRSNVHGFVNHIAMLAHRETVQILVSVIRTNSRASYSCSSYANSFVCLLI